MKEEKFCRHCGGKLDINTNRCLKCGKEQRDFLKKHPLFIPVVCVVLLICISIGIIFYGINSIHKNSDSAEYSKLDSLLGGLWDNISTTPEEIIQSYKDDFEESESKYSYTYLEITGKIQSIEENDKILKIQLQTDKKDDYKVYCYFDKEDNDAVYDELKNYKAKAEYYIRQHQDNIAIAKLKTNKPLTSADMASLEEILWGEVGTKQDYELEYGTKPLGEFVREIVGLDMNAAKEAFSEYLTGTNLDSRQIYFVNQIIEYIVHNGVLKDFSVLQESPFTDQGSVVEIFTDMTVWAGIRKVIESINANAA